MLTATINRITQRLCPPSQGEVDSPFDKKVAYAAALWSTGALLPVGVAYLGCLLLSVALLLSPDLVSRWRRVRMNLLFWPVLAYLVWTLLVLAVRPWTDQTSSNLFHGIRISLTLVLALMLWPRELRVVMAIWLASAFLALSFALINAVLPLPKSPVWNHLLTVIGNKTIASVVGISLAALVLMLLAWRHGGWKSRFFSMLTLLGAMIVAAMILPSRTTILLVLACFAVALIHRMRDWRGILGMLAVVITLAVTASQVPKLKAGFDQGQQEISQALQLLSEHSNRNSSSLETLQASWELRAVMYAKSMELIQERPLLGWGIGSWHEAYQSRVPVSMRQLNAPHNDFLWMGVQAGLLGLFSLLAIFLAMARVAWLDREISGTIALVFCTGLFVTTLFNSALRDAHLAMPLLWVTAIGVAWASQNLRRMPICR